jgi:hypothetical protein
MRDLSQACHGAGIEQDRDVHRDDEGEHPDEKLRDAEHPDQGRLRKIDVLARIREHARPQPGMGVRVRRRGALSNRGQFRLGFFERDARREASEHVERRPLQ